MSMDQDVDRELVPLQLSLAEGRFLPGNHKSSWKDCCIDYSFEIELQGREHLLVAYRVFNFSFCM